MDLSDIKRRVKRQFGDESGAQITDADIVDWANDGQVDIVRRTDCLEKHYETDAISGDASYELPSDFIKLRRVSFDGSKLERIELEELDSIAGSREATNQSGSPSYYYIWGRKLFLYPSPASSGTGNLDIYYVKVPDTLASDSDTPEIPVYMHEDIIRYCLARAKELDEEDEKAQALMQEYETRIAQSADDTDNPESDSYPAVRVLGDDMGYAYGVYW